MANVQLQTPKNFDLKNPDGWPSWKKQFEQFCIASGLSETDEARQIRMLLYCIGLEAESVLDSMNITPGQRKKYDSVIAKLDWFFQVRKNTIFERAKFNHRCQGEDETAEQFITALFALAENCNYGDLRDELIRDRLVVGIKDTALSEHLQMDPDLTLDKAMKAVRQRETVREQQTILNKAEMSTGTPDKLDSVKTKAKGRQQYKKKSDSKPCGQCGKSYHSRDKCPAKDATCYKRQKKGHFSSQCFSKQTATQHNINADSLDASHTSDETITFLDVVQTENNTVWNAAIQLNHQEVTFKLDTGVEVTAISHTVYEKITNVTLQKASRSFIDGTCTAETRGSWTVYENSINQQ